MKFSVIIPVYNVIDYVSRCLESVLAAGRRIDPGNYEVICVDDGSTDGSGRVLDGFAHACAQVHVVHCANAGVSSARNVGLEKASGDWVVFVDADDAVLPELLAYLDEVTENCRYDIIHYSNFEAKSPDEAFQFERRPLRAYDLANADDIVPAFLSFRNLLVWNGCFRKAVLHGVRFQPLPYGEDSLFAVTAFCRARFVAKTGTRLYEYLQRPGSAMHRITLSAVESSLRSLELRYHEYEKWRAFSKIRRCVFRVMENTLGGLVNGQIDGLPLEDRNVALDAYLKVGKAVLKDSCVYSVLAGLKARRTLKMLLHLKHVARVALVRLCVRLRQGDHERRSF